MYKSRNLKISTVPHFFSAPKTRFLVALVPLLDIFVRQQRRSGALMEGKMANAGHVAVLVAVCLACLTIFPHRTAAFHQNGAATHRWYSSACLKLLGPRGNDVVRLSGGRCVHFSMRTSLMCSIVIPVHGPDGLRTWRMHMHKWTSTSTV